MSKLIRNTTTARIDLPDLEGTHIQAGETMSLENTFLDISVRTSVSLIENIANGNLVYSDGAKDFAPNDAIQLIRGLQQILNTTDNGKQIVIPSNRPTNTFAYFTGAADDVANNRIGKGNQFLFDVPPQQSVTKTIEFTELVYFMGANCYFSDADFGVFCDMTVWAPANFPIPAGGTGNYDIDSGGHLIPNASNTGAYYVFPVPVPLNKFVNNYFIMGDAGRADWVSPDVARLFKGWSMKMSFTNPSTTKNLKAVVNVQMYRVHSV